METIIQNFNSLDIRVGAILTAKLRDDLKRVAIQLTIDFGDEIGVLGSSAQISELYLAEALIGRRVVALVNVDAMQIGNIKSECLVLGFNTEDGVVLIEPERDLKLGSKLA